MTLRTTSTITPQNVSLFQYGIRIPRFECKFLRLTPAERELALALVPRNHAFIRRVLVAEHPISGATSLGTNETRWRSRRRSINAALTYADRVSTRIILTNRFGGTTSWSLQAVRRALVDENSDDERALADHFSPSRIEAELKWQQDDRKVEHLLTLLFARLGA